MPTSKRNAIREKHRANMSASLKPRDLITIANWTIFNFLICGAALSRQ